MDLASAEAEIRHVFGDTPITEASIGAAPPDILVKLSGALAFPRPYTSCNFIRTAFKPFTSQAHLCRRNKFSVFVLLCFMFGKYVGIPVCYVSLL